MRLEFPILFMTAPHLTASDPRLAARASRPKHAVRWAIRPRAVLWDRNCRTRVGPAQRAINRRLAADYPVISRRSPGSRPARHQAHRRPTAPGGRALARRPHQPGHHQPGTGDAVTVRGCPREPTTTVSVANPASRRCISSSDRSSASISAGVTPSTRLSSSICSCGSPCASPRASAPAGAHASARASALDPPVRVPAKRARSRRALSMSATWCSGRSCTPGASGGWGCRCGGRRAGSWDHGAPTL